MDDTKKKIYSIVKDYTVSAETFGIYRDDDTDMLITFPKPTPSSLAGYYKSKDYISHTDANKSVIDKLYQFVKKFSIKKKIKLISKLCPKSGNILDIGAGTGDFLVAAQANGWNAIGVEPNVDAATIITSKNIKCFSQTINLEKNSFDVITMWHVLEHVPNLEQQLQELKRLLKPDGTLIIAVPNYKSFDAKYYGRFWAAFDVPRHFWHFSKTSIKIIFDRFNFQLQQTMPLKFDAYYVSMLSEKYQNGKISYFNAFFIGFKSNWKARKTNQFSSLIYIISNK